MRYGIITYGSRGDIQPYIALALGLMEAGHQVTLLANENFKEFAENYGVDFYPLQGNIEAMLYSPEVIALLKTGNLFSFLRHIQKLSRKIQPQTNKDIVKGCGNSDVLIASPLTYIWVYSVAEKLGKKWAFINLSIPSEPTKEFPFAGFDFFDATWYNIFTHRLIRYIYWRLNKKGIHAQRETLGLPPLKKSVVKKISEQKILSLYAFSPALICRPKDWDDAIQITGFLTIPLNKRTEYKADDAHEDLMQWLSKGQPPIYIGFGSIPIPDLDLLSMILRELIEKTEYRFIFCQGWSKPPELPDDERVFVVKNIDHQWLFPQCTAAIVHGGIGTIAAALKAKIPVIILSIFADQPLWGKIITRKNIGVHIPFKKLTYEKLLDGIKKTQTPGMKKSVTDMGWKINGEDGLRFAINKIEKYFV